MTFSENEFHGQSKHSAGSKRMLFLAIMLSGRSRRLLIGISLNIVAANRRRGQSVF